MSCTEWNESWIGLIYDELETDETARARAHLEACPACRQRLDRLELTRARLRAAAPEVPAAPRILPTPAAPRWRPWLAFAAGVVAAAFLFGLGVTTGRLAGDRGAEPTGGPATLLAGDRSITTDLELQRAIERLEARLRAERADELDYLLRSITATELRTGTRIDRTQQALQLLAVRQDPRFTER